MSTPLGNGEELGWGSSFALIPDQSIDSFDIPNLDWTFLNLDEFSDEHIQKGTNAAQNSILPTSPDVSGSPKISNPETPEQNRARNANRPKKRRQKGATEQGDQSATEVIAIEVISKFETITS